MTVFHWLVILILLASLLLDGSRRKNKRFLLVAAILMYCVFGLRDAYSVGIDTIGPYITKYEWASKRDIENMPTLSNWFEQDSEIAETQDRDGHSNNIGLDWVMRIYHDLTGGSYEGFIQVSAAFVTFAVIYFIYRYSPSPIMSILLHFGLLFYTFHFSGLKQSMAMSILLFSVGAIVDRKPIRFLLIVFLASLFHFPALVFLPAYWICNMRLGRRYLFVLAAAFLVTFLFRDRLVTVMNDVYSTELSDGPQLRFLANKVIVMIAILVMAVIIRPPDADDRVYSAFLMMTGIAAVIQTFAGYNNTFERLADYYFQTSIVMIPMIFEKVKISRQYLQDHTLKEARAILPYFICAFAIWRFLSYVQAPYSGLTPYQFFFERQAANGTLIHWFLLPRL